MASSQSNRIIATPSAFARDHYLFVQEVGSLQSLSPHISRRDNLSSFLFFVVTSGSGTLHYRGEKRTLVAGDCIFLNCREPYAHESSLEHPWELSWVHFYGKQMDDFYKNYIDQNREQLFHPGEISEFLDILNAIYEAQSRQDSCTEISCHKYLTDLLFLLFTRQEMGTPGTDSTRGKLSQVRSYLDASYAKNISLDELSSLFFISKFHLSREFKRIYGVTVGSYLLQKRLSEAKNLLRFSQDAVDTISRRCGFSDAGYFIKVFKKSEGMTPHQYRRKW
ncbi:MAG: helix-turn-helix domain-containing protein [Lachnospiraceae bacterium]|nr:helix-turn-helix domain-containing protein [Lachnospiraceae bacterium]